MFRAFFEEGLPGLLVLGLFVWTLIECIQTPEAQVRNLPKVVWIILIIIFSFIIGPLAWLLAGRPQRTGSRRTWAPGNGFPEATRPRPLAPDDDPVFLGKMRQDSKDHEALLKQWEADLRRREQGLRGKDEPKEPGDPA
jgi:Phospholipase_D-nuclease N-terminal